MRLGDLDFPIDPRTLESGAISWTDAAASIGCPSRATRRLEELEAAARLQSALAATAEASGRWCPATSGFVEVDGREAFYVVSRLPDGAQPLAALLEAAAAEPAGGAERRRATLAWSLGVGALRALLDLHERGTHHGELSPESAIRDRIVVRRRTTDPKDLEVDVALQFPSPRLALLLEAKRQPEVGSAEQTDVARLAHILRAILHGRDVLDPDTGVDDMLLSRVFGAQQQAWQRFFEDAAAGALHADPEFIRRQLALLEPARPDAGGSGQLHDVRFKLRRLFAKPAARWGAAAAAGALVATVGLVLAWDTLFPPPTWTVVRDEQGELTEGGTLSVRIKPEGDGSAPKAVVATASKEGEDFTRIEFYQDGSNWKAELPVSDGNYEIIFADKNGTTLQVVATDAPPEFKLVKSNGEAFRGRDRPQSDDDGTLEIYVQGEDEDSPLHTPPTVQLRPAQGDVLRPDELAVHSTQPMNKGAGASTVWKGTLSLRDLQAEGFKTFKVFVNDKDIGSAKLRDVPYELKLEPEKGLEEGKKVKVALEIKGGRKPPGEPLKAHVVYDRDEVKGKQATLTLDGQSADFTLPESSVDYKVTVTVGNLTVGGSVAANDDQPEYRLRQLADPPAVSDPFEVALEITATDPDHPSIARPQLTLNGAPAEFVSKDSLSQPGPAKWTGTVRIRRGESEQTIVLEAGSEKLEVKVPARQRLATDQPLPAPVPVPVPVPERPPAPPPVTLTARLVNPDNEKEAPAPRERETVRIEPMLGNVAAEQLADSYATLAWELVAAPDSLKAEIEAQLNAVNQSEKREGGIVAPEYDANYEIKLKLKSIGDRKLNVAPSPLVIKVTAENDAAKNDIRLTDGNGRPVALDAAQPVVLGSAGVTIAITVTDEDSDPKAPKVQVDEKPFTFEEGIRNGQIAEFVATIPTPPGDTVITIADKSYKVRWEPRDPISAGLPDYGWKSLGGDRWISEQIGFSGDEFKLASAQGAVMGADRLQALLDGINLKQVGLAARLVTFDELRGEMGNPTQTQVVAGLMRSVTFDGILKDVPDVGLHRNLLREKKIDLDQLRRGESAPPESKLTFCSASDGSTVMVGLPLTAILTDLPKIRAALDVLLTDGKWDPKPWRDGEYKSAYAVIVVEKVVEKVAEKVVEKAVEQTGSGTAGQPPTP